MSIQEITERANVHRGTFYAHFADKYALLEAIIREEFRDLLTDTLPPVSRWERNTLYLLIQSTLEYFKGMHRQCPPLDIVDPLVERVTQEELDCRASALAETEQKHGNPVTNTSGNDGSAYKLDDFRGRLFSGARKAAQGHQSR